LFTNSLSAFVSDSRFHFCKIGHLLDEVSSGANLVLTTSSTSSLEFIAQGICVGVACADDNQQQYYDLLGQLGVAAQIGLRTQSLGWDIDVETIRMLISQPDFRERLAKRAVDLIDFHGVSRIVDAITSL